jgi:hypothetical protein
MHSSVAEAAATAPPIPVKHPDGEDLPSADRALLARRLLLEEHLG